jgi:hypothetical protein
MSFIIAVYVGEGIVLASDSRTTYHKTDNAESKTVIRMGVHTSDTADKTFICPNGCGISTCGDSSINGIPITGRIQSFIREKITADTRCSDMPQLLIDTFNDGTSVPDTKFIVAGYDKTDSGFTQSVYKVHVKSETFQQVNSLGVQGATWDGEITTLTKLIQPTAIKNPNGTYSDLPHHEILWNFFTLQDAVGFAKYAVETTINTMHYQNVVETVGHPIDILVIQPDGARWISKKELRG